ncbi:hypothetical protein [Pseudogemmobacter bohemicus]|uniref:hypothetical protein n=1 Tax=Pseudogemmobacter bohemicus TaxID=2250708 RepID=UPI000DD460CB|nr:hypothetical protein [Pseudogemmobacter bohemicus]
MGNAELNGATLTGPDLDRVFIRARAGAPDPSDALMERVMRDALAAMPAALAPVASQPAMGMRRSLRQLWSSFSAGFGGSGVVASLGAVTAIALFLGYTAPAGIAGGILAEALMPLAGMADTPAGDGDDGIEIEPVAIYFLAGG